MSEPSRNDDPRGSLVTAGTVARWTGRDVRTVRSWVRRGVVAGRVLGGRYYVARDVALALRDAARDPGVT